MDFVSSHSNASSCFDLESLDGVPQPAGYVVRIQPVFGRANKQGNAFDFEPGQLCFEFGFLFHAAKINKNIFVTQEIFQ